MSLRRLLELLSSQRFGEFTEEPNGHLEYKEVLRREALKKRLKQDYAASRVRLHSPPPLLFFLHSSSLLFSPLLSSSPLHSSSLLISSSLLFSPLLSSSSLISSPLLSLGHAQVAAVWRGCKCRKELPQNTVLMSAQRMVLEIQRAARLCAEEAAGGGGAERMFTGTPRDGAAGGDGAAVMSPRSVAFAAESTTSGERSHLPAPCGANKKSFPLPCSI